MTNKTIKITGVVDVVGGLATDSLSGQIYFVDNNKAGGSKNLGTEQLETAVEKGDRLVWTVCFLECEAYACIEDIIIDPDYCEPELKVYQGTDVSYWTGIVKRSVKSVPYNIRLLLGTREEPISTASPLKLIGT